MMLDRPGQALLSPRIQTVHPLTLLNANGGGLNKPWTTLHQAWYH